MCVLAVFFVCVLSAFVLLACLQSFTCASFSLSAVYGFPQRVCMMCACVCTCIICVCACGCICVSVPVPFCLCQSVRGQFFLDGCFEVDVLGLPALAPLPSAQLAAAMRYAIAHDDGALEAEWGKADLLLRGSLKKMGTLPRGGGSGVQPVGWDPASSPGGSQDPPSLVHM